MGASLAIDAAPLAKAAAAGDQLAWQQLVRRWEPVLRGVARRFRLNDADVDDVVQSTWLLAYTHIGSLDDPAAIGSWMIVVARREAMRTMQRVVHEVLTDTPVSTDVADPSSPEAVTLELDRSATMNAAVSRLHGRQRVLIETMLRAPDASYEHLSTQLQMPVGSIGPTRDRALGCLRRDPSVVSIA
jgi:RNA polymerase sigma factor (sigma-70 family)